MITKERLEELIKQGATVYSKYRSYWLKNEEENKLDFSWKRIAEIKDNKLHYIYEDSDYYDDFDCLIKLEDLFETKEEVEEYLEFDTTQKTEILLMCDWSVAKDKKCGYCADFWVDGSNYSMLISGDTIYIQEEYYSNEKWNKDILFKESLNRENYDKARRLCMKLFLGDSKEGVDYVESETDNRTKSWRYS